eukprot:CAMPEP_0204529368 /NCGR_PEP_ID=MMETSP0661-20131031/10028_1 /ASSEMBLY_ACC=CAM_ASM_000606 /TAXON_ID=109239 /ORGANISM="Alexandrium margalefi, Strain AMGDE01CS-322" /LENGTH=63 /DNA_ID=CAMNT_0051535387 /DNA_START=62 /DNA_END=249 /DNA_ORIENTATION=-
MKGPAERDKKCPHCTTHPATRMQPVRSQMRASACELRRSKRLRLSMPPGPPGRGSGHQRIVER